MPRSSQSLERVHADRTFGKVTARLMPVLLTAYVAAYLDRVNVGFAKLQMLRDLHFSEAVYGLGAGIFFLGYFLFEVPSNLILHRVGARTWIARIMMTWALVSAAMVFVRDANLFYGLRFLLGIAEAGFFPGVILYLTQWYPVRRRAQITALFMSGIAVSSVIGSLISGWILQTFADVGGLAGWQWLFVLEALPALVLGVCVMALLPNTVRSAAWLDDDDKARIEAELAQEAPINEKGGEDKRSVMTALADGTVWLSVTIYFCLMSGLYGLGFWLPTLISEMGIKMPLEIGGYAAIPYTVAAIGMVLVGRSADHFNERRWHVAVPALIGAAGLVIAVVYLAMPMIAMAGLCAAAFGILTAPPLFWSLPTSRLSGVAAAAGIATINSFGNLSGFLGPYAIGWLKDVTGTATTGMYGIAGLLMAGALLTLMNFRPR